MNRASPNFYGDWERNKKGNRFTIHLKSWTSKTNKHIHNKLICNSYIDKYTFKTKTCVQLLGDWKSKSVQKYQKRPNLLLLCMSGCCTYERMMIGWLQTYIFNILVCIYFMIYLHFISIAIFYSQYLYIFYIYHNCPVD